MDHHHCRPCRSQSRAWRRSPSIGAPSLPLGGGGDTDRATPSPSPSATLLQPVSTGSRSVGGGGVWPRSSGTGGAWPRSAARSIQRSTPGGWPRGGRTPEARSLPGVESRWPLREATPLEAGSPADGSALSYMQAATARAQRSRASPRVAASTYAGALRSPRSVRSYNLLGGHTPKTSQALCVNTNTSQPPCLVLVSTLSPAA